MRARSASPAHLANGDLAEEWLDVDRELQPGPRTVRDDDAEPVRTAVRIEDDAGGAVRIAPAALHADECDAVGQGRFLAVGPAKRRAVGIEDQHLVDAATDGALAKRAHHPSDLARPLADLTRAPAAGDRGHDECRRDRDHQHDDDQLEERKAATRSRHTAVSTSDTQRQPCQLPTSRASPSPPGAPSAP